MSRPAAAGTVVEDYQRLLEGFRRGDGDRAQLLKRLSELVSLLELAAAAGTSRSRDEVLDASLLTAMGQLGSSRGAVLMRLDDGRLEVRGARGLPATALGRRFAAPAAARGVLAASAREGGEAMAELGLEALCPIERGGSPVAFLGVGPRSDGAPLGAAELALLRGVAGCAATAIGNGLVQDELLRVNRRLQAKLFQLQNLFDLSRELTSSFDEDAIKNVVTATLMGHLLASRCALYEAGAAGQSLVHARGAPLGEPARLLPWAELRPVLSGDTVAVALAELASGPLGERLAGLRLTHLVRIRSSGRDLGMFAVGGRPQGASLSDEDVDFAVTLGRQAFAALEAVRLHRVRLEKERQDRELQIARGIQQGLFPQRLPEPPGVELAASSESCYEIGGDYYDFVPLADGRLALVVADVSGKGTPASLLMASVHASVQALAGASPAALVERLNRFLYLNTQANKFVTLFYGELDPARRRLAYVNAGHVPPFVLGAAGERRRLDAGGPALGLIEDARYDEGELQLREADVVAVVTDGATEALSPADEEFGDERVFAALAAGGDARARLAALVGAVRDWAGPRGCTDDLTALVARAGQGRESG